MTTEVAKPTEGKELFSMEDDKMLAMMGADAEEYQDDTAIDDIAIPRLKILQAQSGEANKADASYIKGAESGDFLNDVSKQTYAGDKGIIFVPVKRRVVYIEWREVDAGGGLIANHGTDSSVFDAITPNEEGKRMAAENVECVKTHEVFGYIVAPDGSKSEQIVISLSKTASKKMKQWNAMIRGRVHPKTQKQLPEYACSYLLKTTVESNDKNSWFNWDIKPHGYTLNLPVLGEHIYNEAKEFAKSVAENKVGGNYESEEAKDVVEVDETAAAVESEVM